MTTEQTIQDVAMIARNEHRAYVVSDPDCCDGYWLNYARPDGTMWTQATEHETPRAAIDAAKG